MKRIALALLSSLLLYPSSFGQGALTPPGPPAPTMKTLDQLEPRTPISSAPFTISQPGSYYLTTNLTVSGGNAITIAANGVTLDLNGFTISSTTNPASGTAVLIASGLRNIAIQNGHIQGGVTNNGSGVFSGPGFGYGIYYTGFAPQNVRVSGVSVSGCQYDGIYVGFGASTTVENCVVRTVGGGGIAASTILGCVALDCGDTAIYGRQVSDSRGQSVGSFGTGLSADTAVNCYGSSSSGTGLSAITAQNCYGQSGSGDGLSAITAQNCYGQSGSSYGLYANTAQNCYGTSSSYYGLDATTALNCYGQSDSNYGLYAFRVASGCFGYSGSGTGLYAFVVNNCFGESAASGYGIYAFDIAIGSYGKTSTGPAGLRAYIANSCDGSTLNVTFKYNMP